LSLEFNMQQPIPRQNITTPDFFSEEYNWLMDTTKGNPSILNVAPAGQWSNTTTTIEVSSGIEFKASTIYELDKSTKLYTGISGVGTSLNGKYVRTDTIIIKDEIVSVSGVPSTYRVTSSDSTTIFQPKQQI
jgi:hypothetical protein